MPRVIFRSRRYACVCCLIAVSVLVMCSENTSVCGFALHSSVSITLISKINMRSGFFLYLVDFWLFSLLVVLTNRTST